MLTTPNPDARRWLRIWRGYWDVAWFAKTFLPDYFRFEYSRMHLELLDLLQYGACHRGRHLVVAAPRGNAKTTVMLLLQCIHAICYGYERYIVIVGQKQSESADKVAMLLDELRQNPHLKAVFGNLAPGLHMGGRLSFTTANGVKVKAISRGQSIRGQQQGGNRPTLMILDDVETLEEVQNPELREATWTWLNRDILPAGQVDGSTNITVIGTCLHDDALLPRLLNQPGWVTRRYRSIESYATQDELWAQWQLLLTDLEDPERETTADRFFYEHHEAMLDGTAVLWPEVEPYDVLMRQRVALGTAAFNAEKQNEPFDPEACIFNMADAHRFHWDGPEQRLTNLARHQSITLSQLHTIYAFWDPTTGEAVNGDYGAIVVAGKDANGYHYVLDAWLGQQTIDAQMAACETLYQQWQYSRLYVESNGFQVMLWNMMKDRLESCQDGPRVYKASSTQNKNMRIAQLQPLVASGQVIFRDDLDHRLIEQLSYFPSATYDDGPDALAGVISKLYSRLDPTLPRERPRRRRANRR